jgi:hypothetical protein
LDTHRVRVVGGGELPDLLTVEEAAVFLRIGRTKAYALARQWRVTGGKAGLPVIDFGNVLRVPRHALEELIGAKLHAPAELRSVGADERAEPEPPTEPVRRPTRRSRTTPASQLGLFDPPEAS